MRDTKGRFVKGCPLPSKRKGKIYPSTWKGKLMVCFFCKENFYSYPSRIRKFCSRQCKDKFRKGTHISKETKLKISKNGKGRKLSLEARLNIAKGKEGTKNPMWKGDRVGKISLHTWIKKRKQKAKFCQKCKKNPPYDLANISQNYKRDINDFRWLCRKCHMLSDGRLEKFSNLNRKIMTQDINSQCDVFE